MQWPTNLCLRCRFLESLRLLVPGSTAAQSRGGIRHNNARSVVTSSKHRALPYTSLPLIAARSGTARIALDAGPGSWLRRNGNIACTKGIALSDNWFEKNGVANGTLEQRQDVNGTNSERTTSDSADSQSVSSSNSSSPPSDKTGKQVLQTTSNSSGPEDKADHESPSARTIQLGRTIRTLQTHLPGILQSSLPSDVLSPQISLHLFPSTHPHLPVAKGKVAYKTALWTSPFVWGQIPGRAKLVILSERVIKPCEQGEQLIVRWRTDTSGNKGEQKSTELKDSASKDISEKYITPTAPQQMNGEGYSRIFKSSYSPSSSTSSPPGKPNKEFTGLFIFTFDSNGLLAKHTIEHAEENFTSNYEENTGVGGKVIGVTEWLLKKAKQAAEREKKEETGGTIGTPGLAWLRSGMGRFRLGGGDGEVGRKNAG